MSLFTNFMTVDPVVKRLMLTAVSYSIAEIREHAMLKGMLSLKKSLQISNSDDFKVGIICGEAFARAAVMLRMYMGREPTREESELMIALLIQRSNDIRDSLYKSP